MNRKDYLRNYAREYVRKRRATYFVDKVCSYCGSTERLELHHVDPSTKVSHNVWSWSEVRRNTELVKCIVLCHNCHLKETIKQLTLTEIPHGTDSGYDHFKCRCEECKKIKSIRNAKRVR